MNENYRNFYLIEKMESEENMWENDILPRYWLKDCFQIPENNV